ncbi:MAG: redoxin domain-containing protein [Candidatus Poribacteria bacterium]|nr:redoxin domain-containing protein [Candidatus Poribacteria bacterium]
MLVLNKDGSGHYESVIRFNPQMSTFIEMAEKIEGVKGSPTEGSPFDLVNGHLETTIRSQVEEIEGAHLLKLELTQVGEKNEQRQIALSIDFDDINTFLASPLSAEKLGLRLSRDDHENLRLAGTPGILAARPAIGIGAPSPGTMISEMKSEFGIANDPEFDALFRRLLGSPKSALTFDVPTPITQTNGILVTESKIEWKVDIIDAADALDEYLYEVVLAGEELEFEVREMPPSMAMPPPIMPSSSLLGQPAPGFTLPDLEGNPVSLSDFKGKVVILDFWATWCGPCVVEIPHFIRFQEEFGKKGFTMLGISTDDGVNVVKKFVEEYQVNYPNLMADGNVKALYGGVRSIPTTFVLDRDGVIQRHYVGTQPELLFRRDVETLLAGGELPPQSMHRMPPPGPPQPPLHGSFGATGVVRGNIVEATMEQNLITDVRVVIVDTEGTAYETTTDSQGDYEISGLPPGRYLISVRREGYRERLGKPVAVVAGGDHYVPIKMTKGP